MLKNTCKLFVSVQYLYIPMENFIPFPKVGTVRYPYPDEFNPGTLILDRQPLQSPDKYAMYSYLPRCCYLFPPT
jgi:hypothetical protein